MDYQQACKQFPVGSKVSVTSECMESLKKDRLYQNVVAHNKSVEFVVVRVTKIRDSADDPMVCLCVATNYSCQAGWFLPEDIEND